MSKVKPPKDVEKARKLEEATLLERRIALQEGLPHLYGWKWYSWARKFYESTNKINLLTAANQVSKSTSMIRKLVYWATETEIWPSLWKHRPTQFWYFYPAAPIATKEFETKWKNILPQGKWKDDPKYGWRAAYKNKEIQAIYFNSGLIIYFQSYSQKVTDLQASSVDAIFADEELPLEFFDELMFRLSATDGYFHSAFTATLGQEFWRLCMEPGSHEEEKLPQALKLTVSLYDCQHYEDGSPSHWTDEKIKSIVMMCSTHNEVLRRVFGRFIKDQRGRKYPTFDIKKNMKPGHPVPKSWLVYEGVDPGSGGKENHPAAICFVAVSPDFKQGRVFLAWRGDGIVTSSGDVFNKHLELKQTHGLNPIAQYYDWSDADFGIIADRNGEPFIRAEKSHDKGEQILNTLFRFQMLTLYEDPETYKLATELSNLMKETPKNKAIDDLIDSLRYACVLIPWDFSAIVLEQAQAVQESPKSEMEREIDERRKAFEEDAQQEAQRVEEEIAEWNELYGA